MGKAGSINPLWVSVQGEHDWASWCAAEDFGIGKLVHRVVLKPDANILHISTESQLEDFAENYRFTSLQFPSATGIEWKKVAASQVSGHHHRPVPAAGPAVYDVVLHVGLC